MNFKPPHWQKDAIPTERGWVHPKTGELLVSFSGLLSRMSGITQQHIFNKSEVTLEDFDVDHTNKKPPLAEQFDELETVVDEPKSVQTINETDLTAEVKVQAPRKRGRPARAKSSTKKKTKKETTK